MTNPNPHEPIRRGQVREFRGGRWVVITSDDWNDPGGWPILLPITRRRPENLWLVATADADPIGGSIIVPEPTPIAPDRLGPVVGILTGATMTRIAAVQRALYELP